MVVSHDEFHDFLPGFVDSLKKSAFFRHLLHNIFRTEDRFQVQPLRLHLEPLIQCVLYGKQTFFPCLIEYFK